MIKIKKIIIPYIIILIIIGFYKATLWSFIWIIVHELAHYFVAKALGIKDINITIGPVGTELKSREIDDIPPKKDLIIALAGPIFNIFLGIVFCIIYMKYKSSFVLASMRVNFVLGIFNMFPAFPLDGARVLRDVLSIKMLYRRANKITVNCSIITGFLLLIYFGFLLLFNIKNFSIVLLALFILFVSYKEKERIVYIIMADILKKRVRFLKQKYLENKSISVHFKSELIQVLGIIDKNKYNIFTVLDDNMKVLDIIYEEEIIEALKIYGNITLEELINNLKNEKKNKV